MKYFLLFLKSIFSIKKHLNYLKLMNSKGKQFNIKLKTNKTSFNNKMIMMMKIIYNFKMPRTLLNKRKKENFQNNSNNMKRRFFNNKKRSKFIFVWDKQITQKFKFIKFQIKKITILSLIID